MKALAPLVLAAALSCDNPDDTAPPEAPSMSALDGAAYLPARAIVHTYCAPCHTAAGRDPSHARAYEEMKLDTYDQMKHRGVLVTNALAFHGDKADMPPESAPLQPSPAERQVLLDWLERGCPNGPDGR